MAKPKDDIERAVEALSANTSLFPPGRQRLSELSSELNIDFRTMQQVVAHLSVGLLAFKEPAPEAEAPTVLESTKKPIAKSEEKK